MTVKEYIESLESIDILIELPEASDEPIRVAAPGMLQIPFYSGGKIISHTTSKGSAERDFKKLSKLTKWEFYNCKW